MKKRVLKKWVLNTLIIITALAMIITTGEFDSLKIQLITSIICVTILIINSLIIAKYGNIR